MKRALPLFFQFMLLLGLFACGSTQQLATSTPSKTPKNNTSVEKSVGENFKIWDGSQFGDEAPEKKPEFSEGGYYGFLKGLYTQISYPADAREQGIGGTVWIEVIVNEFGQMEGVRLKEGIGYGCDEEALKAVRLITSRGFSPAMNGGIPVKVKFDIPVKFKIE